MLWQCMAGQLQMLIQYGAAHTDLTVANCMAEAVDSASFIQYR